ncbi:MAG: radical SAM family heme chaperone HemW [Oscillospiraceae bacterium]|nr:radical SAM family heme chaperone HemW [Oscillospiraceae bacterium]
MNKGLYIHIPFCRKKCAYCDFYSLTDETDRMPAYTAAVIRNIRSEQYRYDTVYFGGGTPTLLPAISIIDILSAAEIDKNAEITIEANPETVTEEELTELRTAGVNRISFGVQSLSDERLCELGRIHTAQTALHAIESAQKAGFDNISADLMIGLPHSDGEQHLRDIEQLVDMGITHISVYMLKVEKGTPLSRNKELLGYIDDDRSADEYESAAELLGKLGFFQYEISNFAKKGFECKHNLKYWHCEEYFGVGTSAHSCIDKKRFCVPSDISEFIESPLQRITYTDENACGEEEKLMLALRLSEGVPGEMLKERAALVEQYVKHGLMKRENGRISFTVKGYLVSNEIITQLVM